MAAGLPSDERPVHLRWRVGRGAELRPGQSSSTSHRGRTADVKSIMVGVNDVTHRVRPAMPCATSTDRSARCARPAPRSLSGPARPRDVDPSAQPLRWSPGARVAGLAAAQTIAVVEAGGRRVSLGTCSDRSSLHPRGRCSAPTVPPVGGGLRVRAARTAALARRRPRLLVRGRGGARARPGRGEGVRPVRSLRSRPPTPPAPRSPAPRRWADRGPRGRGRCSAAGPAEPAPEVEAAAEHARESAPERGRGHRGLQARVALRAVPAAASPVRQRG